MSAAMHRQFVDGALAVGETLIHGTLLALLAWLLARTLLRRAGAALHAALWTVVLVKFALPLAPAVPFSLEDLIAALFAAPVEPTVDLGQALGGPATAPPAAGVSPWLLAGELALLAGWLGAAGWLGWRRITVHRDRRRSATALPLADAALQARVARAADLIGVRRLPAVVIADDAVSPHLVGVRAPILVLPRWIAADQGFGDAAIMHELAHLRRRDPWLRLLQVVVGTLFFFWPVVWWINRRIDDAREIACDQWALAMSGATPRHYARALLELARRSRGVQVAGAIAMAPPAGQLGRRIDALLTERRTRPPRVSHAAALFIGLWAVVALGGAARAEAGVVTPRAQCSFDDELLARIMSEFPEADTDGDGALSRDEVCAQQERMSRLAAEGEAPAEARLLGDAELGQVCEEVQATCTEDDPGVSAPAAP